MDANAQSRPRLRLILFAGVAAATFGAIGIAKSLLPPSETGSSFLLHDPGAALWAMAEHGAGKTPYKDFFFNYGPVPLWIATRLADAAGDTKTGYDLAYLAFGVANTFLLALFAARAWGVPTGAAALALTGFAAHAGTFGQIYLGAESSCLLLLALLWVPPERRTLARCAAAGAVLGLMQGIKFGGVCVAGAALLLADLLWMARARPAPVVWRRWASGGACAVAVFAACEAGWLLLGWLWIGAPRWTDFVFPLYLLEWYTSYLHAVPRWPTFAGWGYFLGFQWPAILGLAAAAACAVRKPRRAKDWGIVFLAAFYAVGSAVYFRHAMNMMTYAWMLLPCVGYWLARFPRPVAIAAAVSLLPCAALIPVSLYRGATGWQREPIVRGDTAGMCNLWMTAEEWADFREIEALLAAPPRTDLVGGPVLFAGMLGGGYHFHLGIPSATRQFWLTFPGAIPAEERDAAWRDASRAAALVCRVPPGTQRDETLREALVGQLPFAPKENRKLAERFGAGTRSPRGWAVFWRAP